MIGERASEARPGQQRSEVSPKLSQAKSNHYISAFSYKAGVFCEPITPEEAFESKQLAFKILYVPR